MKARKQRVKLVAVSGVEPTSRANPNHEAGVRADVNDERCPDCGASYQAFRSGEDTEAMRGWVWSSVKGIELDAGLHTDRNVESEIKILSRGVKRAAWSEAHGPGRCVFGLDEYIRDFRANMTGVVILDDREWRLREVIADLLLDEEDTVGEENSEADVSFDADAFAVPEWIDDGLHTTYIAA